MKRSFVVFVAGLLLAVSLGGCVTRGFAGQENGGAAAGDQAAAGLTPSPEVVDPNSGSTSAADQAGAWERHRFFDVWEVGYPDGWTVDRPGTGTVTLTGGYGEHQYRVELMRPSGVEAKDLATWVQSDLETIDQGGAPREEISGSDLPAMKVTNLKLSGQAEGACPAARVYMRTDKIRGEQNYLVMTVAQADPAECDAASIERLAEALAADVRS